MLDKDNNHYYYLTQKKHLLVRDVGMTKHFSKKYGNEG